MSDMSKMDKAANDYAADMAMVAEKFPELRPMMEAKANELAEQLVDMFRPLFDFADGKITKEEYMAITAERQRIDIEERTAKWAGFYDEADETWTIDCADCGQEMVLDELPENYPQCEECLEAEEEDAADEA